ncbi:AraC family transcriptional regulator [Methylophilus sp.]|uniref:AraC family transcriptional regulator n=1 Tax=Methylophilus sp. TaxID=29541 RepID=UPI000D4BEA29|nr:AraC family transcriptional regulator [Methylophilus sp.]PPD11276.1 MAG: AraC family transcriptional regulator [Methylophilus sp.]
MDPLLPLLNQISLSAQVFFTGDLCQVVNFEESGQVGHIHLLRAGQLDLMFRDKPLARIDQPSVVFFPKPTSHVLTPVAGEPCELVCAMIDLGAKIRSPLATALPEYVIVPLSDMLQIAPTLQLLFHEAFAQDLGRQPALDRLAEYFLIQILRHVIQHGQLQQSIFAALADTRLALAVKAMHENPSHPWTLETLADASGMSRARFAANFKTTVGTTPLDYLTDWRLSIAQNLIRQGKPLKSIATQVGYQSPAAFSRVFAKRLGTTPAEWLQAG